MLFSESRSSSEIVTKAHTHDGRVLLEFLEVDGALRQANLQLALPHPKDLEILKVSCWTLLYLKSLFPNWFEVEGWVKSAAQWAAETG